MKSKLLNSFLVLSVASAISIGAAGAAGTEAAKEPITVTTLSKEGKPFNVRTVHNHNATLYSVRDLAAVMGASVQYSDATRTIELTADNRVELWADSPTYTVNTKEFTYSSVPQNVDGSVFVELEKTIEAIGGSVITDDSGVKTINTLQLLSGTFSNPRWVGEDSIIAVKEDSENNLYKINPKTLKSELLSNDPNAAGLIVSPDGVYGAYTNDKAELVLMNLENGAAYKPSKDTSLKTDLVWSADSKKIYFIQGDNQDKIAYLNIQTKEIIKLLEDKVNYKSELRVSSDEKKLLYIVNVTGAAKNDSNSTEESLSIDFSGAGTQLFEFDTTVKDAKPKKLAAGSDNKLYVNILSSGQAIYVSFETEGLNQSGSLKMIGADLAATNLVSDLDVDFSALTNSGQIVVSGKDSSDDTVVSIVSTTGTKTPIFKTKEDISEIIVSGDGTKIVGIADGKVVFIHNDSMAELTK
ncbi:stalk domain-containing protein [Paenibacillus eucommiae]|uniref:Copper amine oxidase-like N-terminal domain-containing protein n=1 Tax=Paenibacillus eucommiae TaxID=1355755 RepID=A0ABS4J2X3_9BACL|nr:stalk domain-containing protein [Paenibacillus eucommiae]MBP1994178.1 hypothetical protein [Paenibacillus eucommiae]